MQSEFEYKLKNPIDRAVGDSSQKITALRFNAPRGLHMPLVKQLVEIVKKAQIDMMQKLKDNSVREEQTTNTQTTEDIKMTEREFLDFLGMTANYSAFVDIFRALALTKGICFKNTNEELKEFDFDRFYFKDIESMMAEYYLNFLV